MKPVVFTLTIALAQALAPGAGSEHRLKLDEAISLALRRDETLQIEREAAAAAVANVQSASGAYDEVLELEGSWQRSNDPEDVPFTATGPTGLVPENRARGVRLGLRRLLPTGGALALRASGGRLTVDGGIVPLSPSYDTRLGLELRQPLLRDRAIDPARLSVRVATADRQGADASLRQAAIETVAGVERAYWGLVAARMGVGVREEAVRLADQQLRETQDRVESGSVAGTELAQPRAELARRMGELLAAREAAAHAENLLKLLILADSGPDWSTSIAPAETIRVEPYHVDVAAVLDRALAKRPELDRAEAVAGRRRVEASFASDGIRPSLDAVVAYDRFGRAGALASGAGGDLGDSFASLRDGGLMSARLALVLALPVRNTAARGSADAARHVERQADAQVTRVRKSIRAEVLDAAATLETAVQRVEAARTGREAAEIQLAAEQGRFETGLSTNFLVLTRQNDLSRARLDEISALTDYRTARTELARASGTLLEERGIDLTTESR